MVVCGARIHQIKISRQGSIFLPARTRPPGLESPAPGCILVCRFRFMGIARPKLFIILTYEALVFAGSCLLVSGPYGRWVRSGAALSSRLILILALFFAGYFYSMWRELYSRNYHYYLKNTHRIVLKNIALALLLVLGILAVLSGIQR